MLFRSKTAIKVRFQNYSIQKIHQKAFHNSSISMKLLHSELKNYQASPRAQKRLSLCLLSDEQKRSAELNFSAMNSAIVSYSVTAASLVFWLSLHFSTEPLRHQSVLRHASSQKRLPKIIVTPRTAIAKLNRGQKRKEKNS